MKQSKHFEHNLIKITQFQERNSKSKQILYVSENITASSKVLRYFQITTNKTRKMFVFWLFLVPIVLARPRGHHSANKRQHVAINLGEKLNIEEKDPNELDIVRQEDDMIKSNLLPNMKDMMFQQQQAQAEENSGLRLPLMGNNPLSNSPVEMNNKKPSEQQNFWLGGNVKDETVGELPQIDNDFHTKIEGEKTSPRESKFVQDGDNDDSHDRENDDSHAEGGNENAGFIKQKMSHEERNEDSERSGNEENKDDDATRRDETESFSNEDSLPDKELEDPKGKLTNSQENHQEKSPEEEGHSRSGKQEVSAKRDVSHSYSMEQRKPDGEISDVLKSVFGENGDPNFPVERQF